MAPFYFSGKSRLLQLAQHRFRVRHFELATLLDVQLRDDAVVDHQRVTLRARAHAELAEVGVQAQGLGVVGVTVGHHASNTSCQTVATTLQMQHKNNPEAERLEDIDERIRFNPC